MGTIEELKVISETVIRRLRRKKLDSGKPFLLWSRELPTDQSYMEYPDNSIKVVALGPDLRSFSIIRELTDDQADKVRKELDLL